MAEAATLAFQVVDEVDQLTQRLSTIQIQCKDFGSLPDNWRSTRNSVEECKSSVESIQATLDDYKDSISDLVAMVICTDLRKVEESVTLAMDVLKNLEVESPSVTASELSHVAGSSSDQGASLLQGKKQVLDERQAEDVKLSLHLNNLKSALETVDSICKETQYAFDRVSIVLESHAMSSDKYHANFDKPPLLNSVMLDFSGDTTEASLKHAVLSAPERVSTIGGRSLLGAVGMGGVGKTVALQGLCHEVEVQRKYRDGVFYASLGQDATEKDIIECVAFFVESSGGYSLARDIEKKSSSYSAAREASLWFQGKCALFLYDDVWSFDQHPTGYLSSLRLLLCKAPSSAIVISTQDKSILQQYVDVKFRPLDPCGQQAMSILAKYADIEIDAVRQSSDAWAAFGDVLDVCAGLPVALGAAGTTLYDAIKESGSPVGPVMQIYAHDLKEKIESVGDRSVGEHRGLRAVIDATLRHCEKWALSAEGRRILGCELNIREKFEALSVVRKHGWIPRTCLKYLWGTDEQATRQLMAKFADMHLVLRERKISQTGEFDRLALHDLVLDQAVTISIENNRGTFWHARILEGYIPKTNGTNNCRRWWDSEKLPEDGYIEKNLIWHLAMSESCELESLVSDVRWTKRRMKLGGLVALREDFQMVSSDSGSAAAAAGKS